MVTNFKRLSLLQNALAEEVIDKDMPYQSINNICGVDVSYKKNKSFCSAVIIKKDSFEMVESVNTEDDITASYVPGYFVLREFTPIIKTLKLLKNSFDILLIDGHGRLHPRECGLACFIGLFFNKTTVGVAKSLLCGKVLENDYVEYNDKILGYKLSKNNKNVYVSVGHKISLITAVDISKLLIKSNEWQPEPLRLADLNSKNCSKCITI